MMWWANGDVDALKFQDGSRTGEGARWSSDRSKAWRLEDGKKVREVSKKGASQIAKRLGLPTPAGAEPDDPAFENVPAMVISPDAPNGHLQGHRSSSSKRTPSKPGPGQATPGGGGRGKQQRERGSVSGGGLRRVPSDSNAVSSPGNSFNEGNKERPGITRKTSASKGGSFKGKGRQQGAKQM
jgi:hypothetical protein